MTHHDTSWHLQKRLESHNAKSQSSMCSQVKAFSFSFHTVFSRLVTFGIVCRQEGGLCTISPQCHGKNTHRADAIQCDSIRCGVVALWLLALFCNCKDLWLLWYRHLVSWSLWFYSCCKASTYDLENRVTVLPPVPLTVTQSSVFSQGFKYQCCNARFKHQFPVLEQETRQEDWWNVQSRYNCITMSLQHLWCWKQHVSMCFLCFPRST